MLAGQYAGVPMNAATLAAYGQLGYGVGGVQQLPGMDAATLAAYGALAGVQPASTANPAAAVAVAPTPAVAGRPNLDPSDKDACRLFVGSLPYDVDEQQIKALVDQVPWKPTTLGTHMVECRVLEGKGCGYIKFGSWEAAEECMECLQNRKVDGWEMPIRLKWAVPKEKTPLGGFGKETVAGLAASGTLANVPASTGAIGSTSIDTMKQDFEQLKRSYLTALDYGTDDELEQLHKRLKMARSALNVATSGAGGLPGAITGATAIAGMDSLSGTNALTQMSTLTNGAAPGSVSLRPPRLDRPNLDLSHRDACRLFIGSLPYECAEAELKALVDQVPFQPTTTGTVMLECRVLTGKGCGYVKFGSWEAAEECMDCLQDRMVDGWKMPLRLKWATPKETRK